MIKLNLPMIFLIFILISCKTPQETMTNNKTGENFAIVIHGGAGTILREKMTSEMETQYRDVLQQALDSGYAILEKGGSAIDAVEASVKIMEDSPLFNAGKGSVYTNEGTIEMDASIMDGKTRAAGAVSQIKTIKNPVTAARAVMEKSEHVFMVGEGAEFFARQNNIEQVDTQYFHTQNRLEQLKKAREKEEIQLDHDSEGGSLEESSSKFGTVGAVALDKNGNLAAATSTGGMTNKKFGRIGDSPIIGAGTYANNHTCAVSATGHGEYFIRGVIAYDISAIMDYRKISLQSASKEVIMRKLTEAGGTGGIIGIDNKGNIAMTFNTTGMYRGFRHSDGRKVIGIFKE
jgi:L-asparaginase / beta-aspartyl-peptidase